MNLLTMTMLRSKNRHNGRKYLMTDQTDGKEGEGPDEEEQPDPCEGTLAGFRYYWYSGRGRTWLYIWYDQSAFTAGDGFALASWTITDAAGNTLTGTATSPNLYSSNNLAGFDLGGPMTIEYTVTTANECRQTLTHQFDPGTITNGWHDALPPLEGEPTR